jgi:hypothetical protein
MVLISFSPKFNYVLRVNGPHLVARHTHNTKKCVCPSYVGYKSRTLAKGYGIKPGAMGTTPGIHENWGLSCGHLITKH